MTFDPREQRLCVITSRTLSRGRSHEEVARLALAAGARMIQFRDKNLDSRSLFETACRLRTLTRSHGGLLIVNDRVDIAVAAEADGVHLGEDDLPLREARRILRPGMILGASAGTVEAAIAAERIGVDYLGVGAIHEARGSKPDAGEPMGVALLRAVRRSTNLPILAIGGIDAGNAGQAIRAGADGVAVISAVAGAEDVESATRGLLEAIDRAAGAEEG
jgi:thiamine-phosphate pyrophosphorylase